MTSRRNIKVVVGPWGDHAASGLWSALSRTMDVELLVLQTTDAPKVQTTLPVTLFPEVPDMLGYYRDLETYLLGADLVVAIESSRLASFQALRCAKAMNVPCLVVVHEFTPFIYDRFPNIRAIKFDIAKNADHFICTSNRSARLLASEDVEDKRVTRIPPFIDFVQDGFNPLKRDKFRNYIGLEKDQFLVVGLCSFEHIEAAAAMLTGFRAFLSKKPREDVAHYKLLLVGQGSQLDSLKYEASDLGIGGHVVFLAQDPAPFWRDVTSAADLIVWDRWRDRQVSETYPFSLAQALASGVDCVIPVGTVLDEVAGEARVIRISEYAPLELAEILSSTLTKHSEILERRKSNALYLKDHTAVSLNLSPLIAAIESLTGSSDGPSTRERVQQFLDLHRDPLPRATARDLSVKVEELLLLPNMEAAMTAELWRVKGDIFSALAETEKAIVAFEKAIQIDERCFRANRGLGYIAWLGHSHDEAMTFFRRALTHEHNDYHALVGVGLIYRRLKMLDESVFWLGRAADIGGPESAAINLLIQGCLESAEAVVSLTTLEKLRESFGDLPHIIRGLSQVYLAQGMSDKAAPLLEPSCA